MRNLETLKKLKKVTLNGMNDMDVAESMYFSIYEITGNKKDVLGSLARCFTYLISIDVSFEVNGIGEIAILYSNSYKNRKDHQHVVESLGNLFDSKIMFRPGKKKLYLKNFRFLPKLLSWFRAYSKCFSKKQAIYYASMLLFAMTNVTYIERIISDNQCKAMVVLSDMHLIDSLLVQKCNLKGIATATLQHGNFELDEPFVLSKSNFFLAHGDYSKSKAISFGMDEKNC